MTSAGDPRSPHVRRLLVAILAAAVELLWRLLPEPERNRLAAEMVSRPTSPRPEQAEIAVVEAGDQLDWDYVCEQLRTATVLARKVQRMLAGPRMYFNFAGLIKATQRLHNRLHETYMLMCRAAQHDGLDLDRGDKLKAVRRKVDIRRGELVDAELEQVRYQPVPEAPTWTINYRRHGGFTATAPTSAGANPRRCYGFASTPRAAMHALGRYFLDAPATIVLGRSDSPRPSRWVRFDVDKSDLSRHGENVRVLLDARGLIYDEHIAACEAIRRSLNDVDLNELLTERADELNRTDPQLPDAHVLGEVGARDGDYLAWVHATYWVPTRLVVATGCPVWGEFGDHRPEVPLKIAKALATTPDLHTFTRDLFLVAINLHRVAAWAGPVYKVGSNGNHRIHTARMLGLPWLPATVYFDSEPPNCEIWDIVARDPGTPRESFERRIRKRQALIEGLLRRRVIDGELITGPEEPMLRCFRLPAPWLLRSAEYATTANRMYESRYPGALSQLGIPQGIGTDPIAWTNWLTS